MKKSKMSLFIIVLALIVIIPFVSADDVAVLTMVNNNPKNLYEEGDIISISLNYTGVTERSNALSGNISFDSSKLEVVDPDEKDTNGNYIADDTFIGSFSSYDPNEPNLVYIASQNVNRTSGTLEKIKFRVKKGATGSTTLSITGARLNYDKLDSTKDYPLDATSKVTVNIKSPLKSISLLSDKTSIGVGEQANISVNYNPADTTDSKEVTFTSSDNNIATVDSNGKVTAKNIGTATITATSKANSSIKSNIDIAVSLDLKKIKLNTSNLEVKKGDSKNLVVSYEPENTTSTKEVTFTSSNENIATVDSNGKVTGVGYGNAVITVTSPVDGVEPVSTSVTVVNHITKIKIDKKELNLNRNGSDTLNVTYEKEIENEETTDDPTIIWTSSDDSVVKIENGTVTALKKGTATITATLKNRTISDTSSVTVRVDLESFELGENFELQPKTSKDMNVLFTPSDADDKTLTWTSSNPNIVSVDNGKITANKPGTATITATKGQLTDSVVVTVPEVHVSSVSIKPETAIEKGKTEKLTATFLPENTTDSTDVTWSSSDNSIAMVDSNGTVTAVSPGTATITATINGVKGNCAVTVYVPVESIQFNEEEITINKNTSKKLTYTVNPEDTTDPNPITFSSKNTSVATVDSNGTVTGLSAGDAVIEIKKASKTDTMTVHVKSPLTSISLNETSLDLIKNQSETIIVNYNPTDTTDSKKLTYSIDDPDIASVNSYGKVTAHKEGKTTLRVKSSVSSVAEVTCQINVSEIHIDPNETSSQSVIMNKIETLRKGQTFKLKFKFFPENTTDDKNFYWESSDESIATIDDEGLVVALKQGQVTFSARYGIRNNKSPLRSTTNAPANGTLLASITLNIVEIPITGVTVSSDNNQLYLGETKELKVNVLPEDTTDPKEVTYVSSDDKVVKVDANGKVTGLKPGKAVISVITTNGLKSQIELTVLNKTLNSVPKTIDNIKTYTLLFTISGIAIAASIMIKYKNSHKIKLGEYLNR